MLNHYEDILGRGANSSSATSKLGITREDLKAYAATIEQIDKPKQNCITKYVKLNLPPLMPKRKGSKHFIVVKKIVLIALFLMRSSKETLEIVILKP